MLTVAAAGCAVFVGTVFLDLDAIPTESAAPPHAELRASLQHAEKSYGATSAEVADALGILAYALQAGSESNLVEARQLAERALAVRESLNGPDDAKIAASLELLTFILWKQGDYAAERPLIERALRIRERASPPDEIYIAGNLHFLSDLLRLEGDLGSALVIRERLGTMLARLYPPESDAIAFHHSRLAQLQEAIGDYDRALGNAKRAVEIRQRVLAPQDPQLAASLNDLGSLFFRVHDMNGAERAFRRALAISEAQPNPDPAAVARAVEHLGEVFVERGDFAAARVLFERALELRRRAFDVGHVLVARSLERLGAVERRLGLMDAARRRLRAAVDLQERAPAVTRPELATTLRELALLSWSGGQTVEALNAALHAESITREHFQFTAAGLSEREALAQARARERGLDLALTCALALNRQGRLEPRQATGVFDAVIHSRALVLDMLAGRHRVVAVHPDPQTSALVEDLRRARNRLMQLTVERVAGDSPGPPDALQAAEVAAESAERLLAERSREFREELAKQRTGESEIRAALPRDAALVSFVRYLEEPKEAGRPAEARDAAFVLRADEPSPRLVALGPAREIDDAVRAWQSSVSRDPRLQKDPDPLGGYRQVAQRLAARLWNPVALHLHGVARVIVTRDGASQSVSFATLQAQDGDYLVSTGPTISYVGAERDLVSPAANSPSGNSLLAVGDPAFGEASSSFASRRGTSVFDPLPGAREEVTDIAARWPSGERLTVLTGEAADEATVTRLAPGSGVLHLATHAYDVGGPRAGGDANPLQYSGLALAGANLTERSSRPGGVDDGILTAEEIALLDLRGVEWAVLSACASGRGTFEPGEGMLGLERSFRMAGARNVIASLWPVEDDATRSWMRELYAARRDGAPAAEAVRHASRALLDRQRRLGGTTHPYTWGGFIAVGDGR